MTELPIILDSQIEVYGNLEDAIKWLIIIENMDNNNVTVSEGLVERLRRRVESVEEIPEHLQRYIDVMGGEIVLKEKPKFAEAVIKQMEKDFDDD